jgi:type IV pilus assembly protein PilM
MFGNRPLVAIDIGGHSIKLVKLAESSKGYELLDMGMISLPPDSMVEGEIENPDAIQDALKNLLKMEQQKSKNAVMGISGQSVIIKKISVPRMAEKDLEEMIREEAEQYLPFDIEEVNLDFEIVSPEITEEEAEEEEAPEEAEEEGEEPQMDVLIVAARKETIQVFQDVTEAAGLRLRVLDLDVFALENIFELNYELQPGAIGLVNIGATLTNMNIIENGITAFSRDIPVGGNTISEEIQTRLSVGFSEAERLKLGIMFDDFTEKDIVKPIKAGIELICLELQKTMDLYEKTSEYKVSKLYLCGGTSLMFGIDRFIAEKLETETEFLKAFRNIKINAKKFDPEYVEQMEAVMAITIGLALRQKDDKQISSVK